MPATPRNPSKAAAIRSVVLLVVALSSCATAPADRISTMFYGKGAPSLSAGIRQFEEGQYPEATRSFNAAVEQGLSSTADLARAHKYLAFIHCVSNRLPQCRDEFARALDASPGMELDVSESGHPIWGPVFKSLKARR